MDFESVDYFCTNIRNDFLTEIKNRDNAMKCLLENAVSYFTDLDRSQYVRKTLDEKILRKNGDVLRYFFRKSELLTKEFKNSNLSREERVEKLKTLCDEIVKNKKVLRLFPFFNDSFIDMILRFSKDELWGEKLSFYYFSVYFSKN